MYSLKITAGKCIGKRSLGQPRHRMEDNIRENHKEMGNNAVNWMELLIMRY